ncbi:hypothetical protein N9Z08_00190 [Pirellulales bacterium]|nr:hypothetical protein [Pirellulales bacterium]
MNRKVMPIYVLALVLASWECVGSENFVSTIAIPGLDSTSRHNIEFVTTDGEVCSCLQALIDPSADNPIDDEIINNERHHVQEIRVPFKMAEAVKHFVDRYTPLRTAELKNEKQNPYRMISESYFKNWVQQQLADFDSVNSFSSNIKKKCTLYATLSTKEASELETILIVSPFISRFAKIASEDFANPALRISADGNTQSLKIISLASVSEKGRLLLEANPKTSQLLEYDKNGVPLYIKTILSEPASSVSNVAETTRAEFVSLIENCNAKTLSKGNLEAALKEVGADALFTRKLSTKIASGSIKQAFDEIGSILKGSTTPLSSYVKTSYAFNREAKKLPADALEWVRSEVLGEMVFVAFDSCGCHLIDGTNALSIMTNVSSNFEGLGYQKNIETAEMAESSNFAEAKSLTVNDLSLLCSGQVDELVGENWAKLEGAIKFLSDRLPEKPQDPFVILARNKEKEAYGKARQNLQEWTQKLATISYEQQVRGMAAQGALGALALSNSFLLSNFSREDIATAQTALANAKRSIGADGPVHPSGYQQTGAWLRYSKDTETWELQRASLIKTIKMKIQTNGEKVKRWITFMSLGKDEQNPVVPTEYNDVENKTDSIYFVMDSINLFL